MEALGRQLGKARDSFDTAMGQLVSGKDNLIKQAKSFEGLGVAVQAALPEHLVAAAELELEHHGQESEVLPAATLALISAPEA